MGISGGREVEDEYDWRVKLGILYYILKGLTGLWFVDLG